MVFFFSFNLLFYIHSYLEILYLKKINSLITYFWLPWVIVVVPGLLTMVAYLVVEHRLCCLRHVGSSRTQELACVSCTRRWILIHCTTSEVLAVVYLKLSHFHI